MCVGHAKGSTSHNLRFSPLSGPPSPVYIILCRIIFGLLFLECLCVAKTNLVHIPTLPAPLEQDNT